MYHQFKSRHLIAFPTLHLSTSSTALSLTPFTASSVCHSHTPHSAHLTLSATPPYLSLHITINRTPTTSSISFRKPPSSIFQFIINHQTKSLHYCTPLHDEFLSRSCCNLPSSSFIRRLISHPRLTSHHIYLLSDLPHSSVDAIKYFNPPTNIIFHSLLSSRFLDTDVLHFPFFSFGQLRTMPFYIRSLFRDLLPFYTMLYHGRRYCWL